MNNSLKCMGILERLNNSVFKPLEFDGFGTLPGFSYPENPDNCLGCKKDMGAGR